jgi:hypothetical protein
VKIQRIQNEFLLEIFKDPAMSDLHYTTNWKQGTALEYNVMEIASIDFFGNDADPYDYSSGYLSNLKIGVP